jgi:hypothetical protein
MKFKFTAAGCFSRVFYLIIIIIAVCSCSHKPDEKDYEVTGKPLFTLLTPEQSGINFNNQLTEKPNINVLRYEYFYNGGGVAVGDVNKDGLEDVYFTGNMTDNKLYLNKGHMQFQDVTEIAGVAGRPGPWKTGVSMADVNGDGNLDFYVCYSGKLRGEKRNNQLFINKGKDEQGIPRFTDEAEQYGLADSSYSTQSVFFDYDKDGDLDMLLLNHNPFKLSNLDEAGLVEVFKKPEPLTGIRLFKNSTGHFEDVTQKAGLKSSLLSYGLGAAVSDVNGDGYPDVYVSNDYDAPDYLYLNNGNATFTDHLHESIGHTSHFSMGNDISDINNDGLPDIFTLDMLPEDNHRQKLLFAPDNYEMFNTKLHMGLYYQYMRNMLHINNGNGSFSEVGQLSGVSNTDWSWAPLFADYDNDGWKDLFVTNGYLRDFTNMDFLKYMGDELRNRNVAGEELLDIVKKMPASNVINYMFKNNGDITFSNKSSQWGINIPSNSNGAAYADLDNDGDLDLVINNINQPAFVYENKARGQINNNYIEIDLKGAGQNTQGIGAKVTVYNNGKQQFLEEMPSRGYQSSVSPVLHFGTGSDKTIDSLCIVWLSGSRQLFYKVPCNQRLIVKETKTASDYSLPEYAAPLFKEVKSPVNYTSQSNSINDFKRQPLMINPLSFNEPCLAKGDINGDGLEDVYAGGGSGKPGAIYIQQKGGQLTKKTEAVFEKDRACEDADAAFFDANGDGFNDLYVVSGGYHNYTPNDVLLQDRLYLNDGKGNFTKASNALPQMHVSKSCVRIADVNGDTYPDLFVGGRVIPGRYPEAPQSYMLINDGKGHFTDQTTSIAPELQKIGMVTDAVWIDMNGDNKKDLIVVGEWLPISIYINNNSKLENKTRSYFDKDYTGWWNKLLVKDLNHDGKPDLVIGNLGLNTQCKASEKQPAEMYYKDFDDNGSVDPILCFYIKDTSFPYVTRDELLDEISSMRTKYTDYNSYSNATIKNIFTEDELKDAGHLKTNYLKTAYFESGTNGKFHEKTLPLQVQFSPVYTITDIDYDNDGNEDLILCGNMNQARLRFGKYDANQGVLLKNDGKGNFSYINQQQSGFQLAGDVRSVININNTLLFGINQSGIKAYTAKRK